MTQGPDYQQNSGVQQVRPIVSDGKPSPGLRVRVNPREYAGEPVYYTLYLPTEWTPSKKWPLVVEFPGNRYHVPEEGIYPGTVEECRMGFDLTRGVGSVWLTISPISYKCSPRVNAPVWWGGAGPEDPEGQKIALVHLKLALARTIPAYSIDPKKVVGVGFSRGAVALGYLGLADDEIARVWAGFWAHSQFDGVGFTSDPTGARLKRLGKRPVMLTWGEQDSGRANSEKARGILKAAGVPVTDRMINGIAHTDAWPDQQVSELPFVRSWYHQVVG
jgi:predicted esterase